MVKKLDFNGSAYQILRLSKQINTTELGFESWFLLKKV